MLSLLFVPLLHGRRFKIRQLQKENLLEELAPAASHIQRDGVIQHLVERARVQQHRHVAPSESNLR